MMIFSAFFIQFASVTDGQTDTDRRLVTRPTHSVARWKCSYAFFCISC